MASEKTNNYKLKFSLLIVIPAIIAIIAGFLIIYLHVAPERKTYFIETFYRKELKSIFFTGFLTLGSFLFTMKSFTLVNLKKEIYDKPRYQADFILKVEKSGLDPSGFLLPFKNLSNLLLIAVFSSLLTSVAQISFGMIDNIFLVSICISMAIFTLQIVLFAIYWLKRNIDVWIDYLEKDDYSSILSTQRNIKRTILPNASSRMERGKQSKD